RHMRMGKSAYQASIDAADEIGLAVVATTMCIVAVFLPVGLMPGISGQFFKNFGLTVVAAVLVSLAVARMITPMVAAYFLKAHGQESHGEGRMMDLYTRVLAWTLDTSKAQEIRAGIPRAPSKWPYYIVEVVIGVVSLIGGIGASQGLSAVLASFKLPALVTVPLVLAAFLIVCVLVGKLLSWIVKAIGGGLGRWHRYFVARIGARLRGDHRMRAFFIGIAALVLTVVLLTNMPQQFQPTINDDSSRVNIEMVPGTTIAQTEVVTDKVARIVTGQPEVQRVMERVREGNARLYIMLKEKRDTTSIEFERRVAPALAAIPDARVTFASQSGGFGTGRDISVMLSGSDPDLLQKTAQTLTEQMQGVDGVVAPRIAADMKRPELVIVPRLDLAAQLGVTTASLSQAIRIGTLGEIDQNAAKFSLSNRQVPIRVILPENSRRDISTIQNLPVPTASGGSVPLSRVAEIKFGAGPTQIQRYNQSRRIFVGADLAQGAVKGPVMEKIQALPIMKNLPRGVSNAPVGDEKWQGEMIQNFMVAVVSGILLVFAVLVLLYHRFVSPLVNMTSLLLAPLGGLLALALIGQPISMPVYIGLLMLLGIVAKNSILLIDFAIEEMAAGVPKLAAIKDAGHKRAQPIVMTTVAMTAGMVPTALSLSGDGAWRQPMGIVVMGGLVLSTLLTLVIVPAGFSLADGFEKRVGPWLRTRLLTYDPDSEAVAGAPHGAPGRDRPDAIPAARVGEQPGPVPAE
ncbi:MAG: efflux RND transporter permease subunit, partial [Proteobacteria bacterium]|nr:efflux RND transporter permease subunit [Pseudomonadota bacterium]